MDCDVVKDIVEIDLRNTLEPSSVTIISPGIILEENEMEKEKEKEGDVEMQYVCVGSMKRPAMSLTRFLRETEKRRRAVLDGVIHIS